MKQVATWIREKDVPYFGEVFGHYPGIRLCDARTRPVDWDAMDGLLLTGGSDISENYLKQPVPDPAVIQDADVARDAWEFPAVEEAMRRKLPIFAICRGFQVLNVALGGTLHLDIPHHDDHRTENVQALRHADGVRHRFPHVNSSHHQALDRVAPGFDVEAWSASDDIIEQMRLRDYPLALAVQYHPERHPLYRPLFDEFAAAVIERHLCPTP